MNQPNGRAKPRGKGSRKAGPAPTGEKLVDLPDLLEKAYRRMDVLLDRDDLSLADFTQLVRAIAYLKGTSGRPPPIRKGGKGILEQVLGE